MLRYSKRPTVPFGPNAGVLYADVRRSDHLYIANSQFRDFRTGVTIDIPAGVTVELSPLYANARLQIDMIGETVHGPRENWEPVVRIWNNSNATVKLAPMDPIAQVRAYASPPTLMWHDSTFEAAPSTESKIRGNKVTDTGEGIKTSESAQKPA